MISPPPRIQQVEQLPRPAVPGIICHQVRTQGTAGIMVVVDQLDRRKHFRHAGHNDATGVKRAKRNILHIGRVASCINLFQKIVPLLCKVSTGCKPPG